jgi:diguanylate cyclase (GGDEF)-like protein
MVAELMSLGLSRLDLASDLATYAYTDPLTGVANRRAADEWLERRFAAAEPFPPVSIVLCDINGLKHINDALGHTAGDALIQIVATHLSAAADEMTDALAARIGGDEFVLLADGEAEEQVETAVARLAATQLPHGAGIAVGAATTRSRPAGTESSNTAIRALMRLADAAQYRHKQTKRLSARSLESASSSVAVLYPQGEDGLADRVLDRLARGTDRSVEWRLQVVADAMAEAFMAASWWVSRCDDGSLVDVLGRIVRDDSRGELAQMEWVSGTEFDLDLYPATAQALRGALLRQPHRGGPDGAELPGSDGRRLCARRRRLRCRGGHVVVGAARRPEDISRSRDRPAAAARAGARGRGPGGTCVEDMINAPGSSASGSLDRLDEVPGGVS